MSKASATTTLTLVKSIGTVQSYLVCTSGDLWQFYSCDASDIGKASDDKFTPNFADSSVAKPEIYLHVSNTRGGNTVPDEAEFSINGTRITTVTKRGSSYIPDTNTVLAAYFEPILPNDDGNTSGCYGLRVKGNIAKLTGGTGGQIVCKFTITEDTASAQLQNSFPFTVAYDADGGTKVVITPDGNNFVISQKKQDIKIYASVYEKGAKVTTGLAYKWYRQDPAVTTGTLAGWAELSGATSDSLTVNEGDVETQGVYMVIVSKSADNAYVGQDTAVVYDKYDTWELVISRNPEDGQVHEPGDSVTVSAEVVSRIGGAAPGSPVTYKFIGYTPAGANIFPTVSNTTGSHAVGYDYVKQADGQLEVVVIAEF